MLALIIVCVLSHCVPTSAHTDQLEREAADKGNFSYDRYNSVSSRLSSVSTPGSLDDRHDSISSIPSSAASLAPAGSVFTLLSPRPYSTTTVTSSTSLLSPSVLPTSPCPPHLPNGGLPAYHSTPRPLTPTSLHSPTLSRNTNLCVLSPESSEVNDGGSSEMRGTGKGARYLHKGDLYSHHRSHSNPHAHLIALEASNQRKSSPPGPPPGGAPQEEFRSPSPPHRAGSHSSVVPPQTSSPGSVQRRTHYGMRRPHPPHPGPTSLTASGEQLAPESPVQRSSAYSSSHYEYPVRSNSLTYTERRASSESCLLV